MSQFIVLASFNPLYYTFVRRILDGPVLAVESTLTLPQNWKFPFEYKYYVHVSPKAKDCYEYLYHPTSSARVNRCIRSRDGLVQGIEGMHNKVILSTLIHFYVLISFFSLQPLPFISMMTLLCLTQRALHG